MRKLTAGRRVGVREPKPVGERLTVIAAGLLTVLFVCGAAAGFVRAFGWRAMSVEEVVRASDLIVLGRVISKDAEVTTGPHASGTFTRSTFRVEAYYKGEGPEEISLLTHGGLWTDESGKKHETQAPDTEGVREGEEMVAFLRSGPGGYYFVGSNGNAKRLVTIDPKTGERVVELRLSKRRYMGPAMQARFDEAERWDKDPNAPVATELPAGKFLTEVIVVKDLAERLGEIIRGESIPARP